MRKDFLQDESGQVAMMAGLVATPLLLAVMGSMHVGTMASQKSKLQDAVDAGALAGVQLLADGGKEARKAAGDHAETVAFEVHAHVLHVTDIHSRVNARTETVALKATAEVESALAFRTNHRDVSAAATAVVMRDTSPCVMVIHPDAPDALNSNGQGELRANNCTVQVNSSSASGARGAGRFTAREFCLNSTNGAGNFAPPPKTECETEPTPFLDKRVPGPGPCDFTNLRVRDGGTLQPGHYCGGLTLAGSDRTRLAPGTYHVSGGKIDISGGGGLIAEEVTVVLHAGAGIDVTGQGDIDWTAAKTGPFAGFAIYQVPGVSVQDAKFAGGGKFNIDGTVFLPETDLWFTGGAGGTSNQSRLAALVVRKLRMSGQGTLNVQGKPDSRRPVTGVRLVR